MERITKKIIALSILSLFFSVCTAEAVQFTATVTADNYYAIYTGNSQDLTFVGKYINDSFCDAGTFAFNVKPGDYIYVAAWNSVSDSPGKGPKAWLGQFVSDTQTILSNTTDWQVYLTNNLDAIAANAAPSVDAVKGDLAKAAWISVDYSTNNTLNTIWAMMCGCLIGGIDPNAKWIWGSSMWQQDNYGDYQLFRTKVTGVPETIPVANASAEQTVNAWIDGFANVSLDGSGSNDENNLSLTYHWSWTIDGNTYQAEGVYPNIQLPAGDHIIQLIVNNGYYDSEPAYVHITAIPSLQQKLTIYPSMVKRVDWLVTNTMAIMNLTAGITKTDIKNQQFLLYPAGSTQSVKGSLYYFQKNAYASILFKRLDIMKIIPNNGKVTVYVVGQLNSGQYFYGIDTITIYP